MNKFPLIIFLLTLSLSASSQNLTPYTSSYPYPSPRAKEVIQNNEHNRSTLGRNADIYCNPLMLDGKPLDYNTFGIKSSGIFALKAGDPNSPQAISIPFFITIRRNGQLLHNDQMFFNAQELFSIEISSVLAFTKPGDQLIIEPLSPEYWKAKRILKILE